MTGELIPIRELLAKPTVYRLYDAERQLLYVGSTVSPTRRLEEHRNSQPWWSLVAHVQLTHYDTNEAMLQAELAAIQSEEPRFNIADRTKRLLAAAPEPTDTPQWGGDRLRRELKARGLSTREFAVKAEVSPAVVGRALRDASISRKSAVMIVRALRLTPPRRSVLR